METLGYVRKGHLIFLILQIFTSLLMTFLIASTTSPIGLGYQPSFPVQFLLTFGVIGLLTEAFSGISFIINGLHQKLSNKGNFYPKQWAAIFLIGLLIFGSSLATGYAIREHEREKYQDNRTEIRCKSTLSSKATATREPVNIPENCLQELRKMPELENLKKGDMIRKTPDGFKIVKNP